MVGLTCFDDFKRFSIPNYVVLFMKITFFSQQESQKQFMMFMHRSQCVTRGSVQFHFHVIVYWRRASYQNYTVVEINLEMVISEIDFQSFCIIFSNEFAIILSFLGFVWTQILHILDLLFNVISMKIYRKSQFTDC